MKINWQLVSRGLFLLLLGIIGYWVKMTFVQLAEIQRDLTAIKLELVKVQNQMLDKDAVRDIVRVELYERGIK
jgi:hypothetical protein